MSMPELYELRPDFPRPDDVKLTVNKVAEILGVSITTVHRLIQHDELQAYQIGNVVRVLERHLVEYFDREQAKARSTWARRTGTRQGSEKLSVSHDPCPSCGTPYPDNQSPSTHRSGCPARQQWDGEK